MIYSPRSVARCARTSDGYTKADALGARAFLYGFPINQYQQHTWRIMVSKLCYKCGAQIEDSPHHHARQPAGHPGGAGAAVPLPGISAQRRGEHHAVQLAEHPTTIVLICHNLDKNKDKDNLVAFGKSRP